MTERDRIRKILFAAVLGIIISFCYAAGFLIEADDSLDLMSGTFYVKWLVEAVLATGILYVLWELADRYGKRIMGLALVSRIKFKLPYPLCVLILFLCWVPAWLSIFPGAFAYDACTEWEQVRDGMITSHHPVLHVLWVGGLLEGLHGVGGSYNLGIAVYTCMQMLLLAGILAYTLRFLKEFHVPDIFCFLALFFYGLSPVIQLFAVSTTKDVLFSGAQLMFLLSLIRFCCQRAEFFQSRKQLVFFGVFAFLTMILRNNGFYIVVVVLVCMIFVCKDYWKKFLPLLMGIGIAYGIYVGPFYSMFHVAKGGVEEMFSVPIQQMARVHQYDYDSLKERDLELLYQIIPKEYLDKYRPTVSDFVKNGFQREAYEGQKQEFFKLWCKWGMEHPLTYLNSFFINTVDFWYPGAVIDGYRDAYGRSCYFDYQVSEPGEEVILLPALHKYYEAISMDGRVQKAPFAFLVLSPGWYLVMTMVIFGYLWRCKRREFLLPALMFLLTMFTVLLGPVALVRYVLILYYAFPILLALFFGGEYFGEDKGR